MCNNHHHHHSHKTIPSSPQTLPTPCCSFGVTYYLHPIPWKPRITILLTFWEYHINGIIRNITFWDCLLSLSMAPLRFIHVVMCFIRASQAALVVKNPPANAGDLDTGLIPRWGKIPWRRKWSPLQYSCLENPMDREAWQARVHRIAETDVMKWLHVMCHVVCFNGLFLSIAKWYPIVWMYHSLLIHSSTEGHLNCFQILVLMERDVINIFVQDFWLCVNLSCHCSRVNTQEWDC